MVGGVDASAVGRVTGITTEFLDLRGGSALFLPQRIGVFAQGNTGVSYSSEKRTVFSSAEAGAVYGYGSPAHLAVRELMPPDGRDGVGSIQVEVFGLQEAPSAAAANGDITPSGTPTADGSYRVRIGGILSQRFVIKKGLLTGAALTAAIAAMGSAISAVLEMPVNVTYDYGTVVASALTGTGNGTLTALSVTGNPLPGVYRLKVVTAVANGGVWSLTDPNGTVLSSSITQTVGAGTATVITVAGLQFTITDSTVDFGLAAYFDITVPGTQVNVVAKWKAANSNGIVVEVLPDQDVGVAFAMTQPTGGLVNPDVSDALTKIGSAWTTFIVNTLNVDDTTALDAFMNYGESRWGTLVHMPLAVLCGTAVSDVVSATTVSNGRAPDRVNSQIPVPASPSLPLMIAARAVCEIAKVAQNSPPTNYSAQRLTGIIPGPDSAQWDNAKQEYAVTHGSSTTQVVDGVVQLNDVMMMYKPTGEMPPAYRYLVDIVREQNIIYNVALIFAASEWAGAPLVPDEQTVFLPEARKPKHAKAELALLFDSLGKNAIISAPERAIASIDTYISPQNPKRLEVEYVIQHSGNSQIINVRNRWGFYYGTQQAA